MGETLREVWDQVTDLLAAGVSVIPVRDREQDGKPAKSPYFQWKRYQTRIIEVDELWHAMEEHNTTAVAIICGEVSGNLEVIDIDVKNWPGIDGLLFEAIRDIYPDLFGRLRVHSTPSGGFHILYRVSRPTGIGNQKLATRGDSHEAGIETRGEGGYIVAPPSLGYQVFHDRPIPVVTPEMRESLINLCRSFDEKVKVAPISYPPKSKSEYYEENPFTHYNRSPEAEQVLVDHGWSQDSANSQHVYFTRPGKSKGISASFHRQMRVYYIFTSSTGLEPGRGYLPSTLLVALRFNGDADATYRWLVDQGYGKIKPHVERRMITAKALLAEPLPANASTQAKVVYLQERQTLEQSYPHGVYWERPERGGPVINREKLYLVSGLLGFRYFQGEIIQITGYLVSRVSTRQYYDALKTYLSGEEDIANALERFLQSSGEFTMSRIPLLDESLLLSSTKSVSFKFFIDCYLEITASEVLRHGYEELGNRVLWETQVQRRPFTLEAPRPEGLYYEFLNLAIGVSPYLWRIIGYLAHEFKDETMGYIVVLIEQCTDPKHGGGTGKNLFSNLLAYTTTHKNIAGVQMQFNEKFLQSWNYERVLTISDLPKRFDFGFLKELSTGSGILKKLFRDEAVIPPHRMPKLVLSSNYSFDISDGGLRRRLLPLEFTSFFTDSGGVDVHFGKMFPYDWAHEDWTMYDNWIVYSIQQFLGCGGKIKAGKLSEGGWLKQFDFSHMPLTRTFIQEHWDKWLSDGFISHDQFKQNYDRFCHENGVSSKFRLTSYRINQAISDWCAHYGANYDPDHLRMEMNIPSRGRLFTLPDAPF